MEVLLGCFTVIVLLLYVLVTVTVLFVLLKFMNMHNPNPTLHLLFVTLDHKTCLSRWSIFVAIAKIHFMGQNDRFFIYDKNH